MQTTIPAKRFSLPEQQKEKYWLQETVKFIKTNLLNH